MFIPSRKENHEQFVCTYYTILQDCDTQVLTRAHFWTQIRVDLDSELGPEWEVLESDLA